MGSTAWHTVEELLTLVVFIVISNSCMPFDVLGVLHTCAHSNTHTHILKGAFYIVSFLSCRFLPVFKNYPITVSCVFCLLVSIFYEPQIKIIDFRQVIVG